jgi:hypothetical protein
MQAPLDGGLVQLERDRAAVHAQFHLSGELVTSHPKF